MGFYLMSKIDNFKGNTKGTQFKSGQEAVENGRKGGIASGVSKRKKKSRQQLLQTFLDGTYTDKKGNKFTGEEVIDRDIASILGNPNHKHFVKIFELLFSEKYEAEIDKTKAEAEYTKAKTAQIKGEGKDIEDLSEIDKMFND